MTNTKKIILSVFYIISVLALFLFSIDLLVSSLDHIGRQTVESVLTITANPFVSLFIGLLITALIQSSSTTTSMIVALVASGTIEMQQTIPIIMGANIGTTLTSNIVALSFIAKKKSSKKLFLPQFSMINLIFSSRLFYFLYSISIISLEFFRKRSQVY